MYRILLLLCCLSLSSQPVFAKRKRATVEVQERKRTKSNKKKPSKAQRSALFTVKVEKSLIKGINKTVKYLKKQQNLYQRVLHKGLSFKIEFLIYTWKMQPTRRTWKKGTTRRLGMHGKHEGKKVVNLSYPQRNQRNFGKSNHTS